MAYRKRRILHERNQLRLSSFRQVRRFQLLESFRDRVCEFGAAVGLRDRRKTCPLWNFRGTATISSSGASLNIQRGTFRLWVVASMLFVIGVGAASYSGIRQEFKNANTDWDAEVKKYGGYSLLPTDCEKARGIAGTDYDNTRNDGLCWYRTEDFRRLYPEYKDVSSGALSERLYAKAGRPLKQVHPWNMVMKTAGVAFGVPLAVLALGFSLFWDSPGFAVQLRGKPNSLTHCRHVRR